MLTVGELKHALKDVDDRMVLYACEASPHYLDDNSGHSISNVGVDKSDNNDPGDIGVCYLDVNGLEPDRVLCENILAAHLAADVIEWRNQYPDADEFSAMARLGRCLEPLLREAMRQINAG